MIFEGYDLYSDGEVAASLFLKECDLYTSALHSDQRYVKEGYEKVVHRLVSRSKAYVKLNCKVIDVNPEESLHKLETTQGDFYAKNVVYALPLPAIQELSENSPNCISNERKELFKSVKVIPLFKVFLEWDRQPGKKQWWEEMNHWEGKSTTDHMIRQAHYYDHEDILIYNSGKPAEALNKEFTADTGAAAHKIFDFLKEMHSNDTIPEPDWESTIFKYWPDGSHHWLVDVDIYPTMEKILIGTKGSEEDKSIFVCGDAFSIHQGWVMGCVQTANTCLKAMQDRGLLRT